MAQKRGLSTDDVLDAAARLADADGYDMLTLASVAGALGVRSPSLYAHVAGLDGLRRGLTLRAAARLAEALAAAAEGRAGLDALGAIAVAYRRFAHRHPGLYAAAQQAAAPQADEEVAHALGSVIRPVLRSLSDLGVEPEAGVHLTRALRSGLHGFVTLERTGGFGLAAPIDESFRRLVALLLDGVREAAAHPHPDPSE